MIDTTVREGSPAPTLQVIGAGLGRTGTLSLREDLVPLGFAPRRPHAGEPRAPGAVRLVGRGAAA